MLETLFECCTNLIQVIKARIDLVPQNAVKLDELAMRIRRILDAVEPLKGNGRGGCGRRAEHNPK